MNYYNRNNYVSKERRGTAFYVRHFCRIFIGVLFLFSAYVKGVDPFGFGLKIEEYFHSFGMNFMVPLSLPIACSMLLVEFLIGISMLFNIQLRIFSWVLLLFMSFFLVLTAYLAFAPSVVDLFNRLAGTSYQLFVPSDCGCFGDFIKLTNTQTFLKNLLFLIPTLVVFAERKRFRSQDFAYISEWGPLAVGCVFILFMEIHCLRHEPWHDFRPWKVGRFIAAETYAEPAQKDYVFQYRHRQSGQIREITMDELVEISEDSLRNADLEMNYEYADRVEKTIKPGIDARLSDFSMMDNETKEDIRQSVIESGDYQFVMFFRDVTRSSQVQWKKLNEFAQSCSKAGFAFSAVTASLPSEVEALAGAYRLPYTFYYCDATPMKTALRNNLGLILLKDGYVLDKWSFRDVPSFNRFLKKQNVYSERLAEFKTKCPPVLPNGELLDLSATEDENHSEK